MKNFTLTILIGVLFIFTFACNKTSDNSNTSAFVIPEIARDAKPVADKEIAVIEMENAAAYGTIKIELYSNIAPKNVARFKKLAKEGFYNGVTFHRITPAVIQSGDPNTKDNDPTNDGQGSSDKPNVEAEFTDISYDVGIVGAARGSEFNSANSQFFITRQRVGDFDGRYTVFGKVIEGLNNISIIAGVPKQSERPVENVVIKSITIQPK